MDIKDYLNEEFITYRHHNSNTYGIYQKPTRQEIKEIIKEENMKELGLAGKKYYFFRFIADATTKKIFVFNYYYLHEYAFKFLVDEKKIKNTSYSNLMRGILYYSPKEQSFKTDNYIEKEWSFLGNYLKKLNKNSMVNEEFYTYVRTPDSYTVEIFKNPTFSELFDERKKDYEKYFKEGTHFRTIIDVKNKIIYIFHGASLHEPVVKQILDNTKDLDAKDLLIGFVGLDEEHRKIDLTFVIKNPYFTNENYGAVRKGDKKYSFIKSYFNDINWD